MAMKPCRECKTLVSSKAPVCPHCGIANPVLAPFYARRIGGAPLLLGIFVFVAFGLFRCGSSSDTNSPAIPAKAPLDYSKPVFTENYAIVCSQGLLIAAGMDNRADHGMKAVYQMFTSILGRSEKVKALGCQEWRAGIRVYARRMEPPFDNFVSIRRTPDEPGELFTMAPHLTNHDNAPFSQAPAKPPAPTNEPEKTPPTLATANEGPKPAPKAGCTFSDIGLDGVSHQLDDRVFSVSGRLMNNCSIAVGAEVKMTAYSEEDTVRWSRSIWPASVSNIPAQTDYPFTYRMFPDEAKGVARYELRVISVRQW